MVRMNARLLLPVAALFALSPLLCGDEPIGFIEKFALAADREAVLTQLIPGSEDYYFYHALQFQNTRQTEKLKAMMAQWAKRFPNSERRKTIENREALLSYDADPQATLKFLRERLDLEFNHQQEARDQKPDLPTALDPKLIAREVFQRESLGAAEDLSQFNEAALEALVRDKTPLNEAQMRVVLSKLRRPDLPNLVEFIDTELKSKESRGFGEFEIHRALLPEQLDELARRRPALYGEQAFVFARLRKLAPGADADPEFDPAEREAWLDRAWAYVSKLSPAFNSLKASILHQRLLHDRTRGVYDEKRFLSYLKLPRPTGYINRKYLDAPQQARGAVDLHADFTDAMSIARPIGSDDELVRDYFLHLFAKPDPKGPLDPDTVLAPWVPYVRDTWLRPILAEAMITGGMGDPERWASLLSPTAFQQLKDRVDIDFARTNAQMLAPADEVTLDLFIKNAPRLIVKIYEINTLSYFLTSKTQLNTDLRLDGLVANRELTPDFSKEPGGQSPFLRTARAFNFPELKGKRGAWVIEFIGGGKSSRALVRKGQWSVLQHTGPAGDLLTVLDEAGQPVKGAVAWLDGRKFTQDEELGAIVVPYTQQPGEKPVVLADAAGSFATLATFQHHAETYRLDAQFHLEREQLLAGRQATLGVRTSLLLGQEMVSLSLLSETKLSLTSTTPDGVSTTSEIKAPRLGLDRDFTHTFTVPERLAKLTVTLTGKVENLSKGGEKQEVTATHEWEVNGIDKTDATSDGHLSKFGDSYVYELLGKNGEALPDRQIVFDFTHREFSHPLQIALRTDERGRVALGTLEGIEVVEARAPNGRAGNWTLRNFERTWPEAIHALAGEAVRVPVPPAGVEYSLLEKHAETFSADRHAAAKLADGFLTMEGLPPGDYALRIRAEETHEIEVRVTGGHPAAGWLVSPNRSLEVRDPAPLAITGTQVAEDAITIQLAQWNRFTRVHVAATRFVPDETLFALGEFEATEPGWSTPDRLPSLYAPGRNIGDEYRYILERRYSKIFPGNMLARPGLLLNPWETRSTDLHAETASLKDDAGRMEGAKAGRSVPGKPAAQPDLAKSVMAGEEIQGANLDFLAAIAPVIWNLTPDEHGVIRIDRKALGDRQHLQIFAEGPGSAVWRSLALPEAGTKFQDLRLRQNLDPAKNFAQTKKATVLATGQSLQLAHLLTSELETYDSLASVYALYTTLSGDAKLAKFAWILDWPGLKEEEKRAKYSEFSCHELNLFLFRKDPEFFKRVVAPYLANKKEKTFVDEYLLSAPLARWLEPWSYGQLNVAERCLLAQRLPGEAAATARNLTELRDLLPPNPQQEDHFFDTALHGRSLASDPESPDLPQEARRAGELSLSPKPMAAGMPPAVTTAPAAPAAVMAGGKIAGSVNGYAGVIVQEKLGDADALLLKRADGSESKTKARLGLESNAMSWAMKATDKDSTDRLRREVRAFFRALGPAKEWAENQYYQVPLGERGPELIPINDFWRDYARWDGQSPFVSPHLAEASRSFPEMMFALAVLDLPFASPKQTTKTEGEAFTLTAAGPLVAFHQEIEPAAPAKENTELLVSQNFFRQDDRYREEGNEKFDKYVSGEFLAGVVYGANIVVTNPTSAPQKLQLLLQIPQGALPVLGSRLTESKRLQLGAYTTQTFEYHFYFPLPSPSEGAFTHYPVHVSRGEESAGAAKPAVFRVVRQLSEIDKNSWDYISQYGSEADVFAWLKTHNLQRLDLDRIAWRARKSVEFFHGVLALLSANHSYSPTLWSYAVYHNDPAALREFLRHRDEFIAQCGPALRSKLLEIDLTERRLYEHLEYSPLVNQRVQRFTAENRIPNPVLRHQYQSLLNILAHRPAPEPMDEMSVVYYLFLQDRTEEALARFHTIKPELLPTRLQYDYFRCYAALYEEQLPEARALVKQYAEYPVDRWRKLFAEAGAQLDEIAGAAAPHPNAGPVPDREAQQAELASTEPSFDFKVENRRIALTWKNLPEVTVNYYLMEPEFLFSSSPFVTEDPARFSIIKPTRSDTQKLPPGKDALELPLPAEFAKANVLVEILGAGQRHAQAYHANTLKLTLAANYGRLEVRDETAGLPVPKAYVKVYARLRSGTVRFYRDGYTDLRGKFDYASQNSSDKPVPVPLNREDRTASAGNLGYQPIRPEELGEVEKFAILILSDAHGAMEREVNPPAP